ncbi:cysteine sulfinic acid decarboxylase isoform X2 [Hyalella azteca]|nr:cysteine sulfinic acid decarboxylase isoform X2 [Hyalella azteca]
MSNPQKTPGIMSSHSTTVKPVPVIENGVNSDTVPYSDGELLQKVLDIVKKEKLYGKIEDDKSVVDFKHPEELRKLLDLTMCREGCQSRAEVDEVLERVVRHSVRTQHPHFYNQLYGGIDEVGLAGAWILEALNTNQHTYEVGPALVITEFCVIEQMVKLFGWTDGGDGIFCPGGSIANMYSMVLARHKLNPAFKRTGMTANDSPLVIFTSDQSHYSISKGAFWLGFGLDNVVPVASDDQGIMHGAALRDAVRKAREEGKKPFYVNATAGTTVFGAYDNFNEIADVCKEEGLWMHVDACWGGAVVLSTKHKSLMDGSGRADSISWNPHKMLCAPLQCSMFLTKHRGLLHEANCVGATYLFQQDKFYDVSYDTGDKSIQCGRKGDALKLWLMFKIHGMDVIELRINAAFEASKYLESEVKRREGFELVREGLQCTNVCFWYIPPALRGHTRTPQWWQMLHKVAPLIKERLVLEGTLLIGYQPMTGKNLVNFFRMINTSFPVPTQAHMNFVLDEIERRGQDIEVQSLES